LFETRFLGRFIRLRNLVSTETRRNPEIVCSNPVALEIILKRPTENGRMIMSTGKSWKDLPAGVVNAAFQRLLGRPGGSVGEVVDCINTDPRYLMSVVQFMINDICRLSVSQEQACLIMGKNYLSVDRVVELFGIKPTKKQLALLEVVPFAEATLRACKDTHILAPVFPLSISDIIEYTNEVQFQYYCFSNDWCHYKGNFTKDKGKIGWYLLRKEPINGSMNKTWCGQNELLSGDEESPTAQVMVYIIIAYFLTTEETLFKYIWVRCADRKEDNIHYAIGRFNELGLGIISSLDCARESWYGMASIINPKH